MVRGCFEKSFLCGYRGGKLNKQGFINNEPKLKYLSGTFKDKGGKLIKNKKIIGAKSVLNGELSSLNIYYNDLPKKGLFFGRPTDRGPEKNN